MARLTTPFGFHSTAAEVIAGIDLSGKRMIVTGAASGIGIETARALADAGAEVTLAVRDTEAGEKVAAEISAGTGNRKLHVARLDLAERSSIAAFVAGWEGPLHVLVNNAGVLGHFALALGLHKALAAAGSARIVAVSSSAHLRSPVIFDDIHFAFRPYEPILAYAQSKTANVLFAVGATARWARDGITANALMPGAIATNLQRHTGGMKTAVELRKTPQEGAATSVLLAASPLLEGIGGRYFANCNEAVVVADSKGGMDGVAPFALDPGNAERLWEESEWMLRVVGAL
jgi:NAD(P)-dependent dehydrogenase (short-subunit alcohol dehydrogenase family)